MFEDWIDAKVFCLGNLEKSLSRKYEVKWDDIPYLPRKVKKPKYPASQLVKFGKVYFQNKRTVLKIGEDVFMSTPEKGEKYDPEKGLLICLMKAMGMTTSDFLKLYERAKDVSKKTKKKQKGDDGVEARRNKMFCLWKKL